MGDPSQGKRYTWGEIRRQSSLSTRSKTAPTRAKSKLKKGDIRKSLVRVERVSGTSISDMNDLQYVINKTVLFRTDSSTFVFATPKLTFYTLVYMWRKAKWVLHGMLVERFNLMRACNVAKLQLHFEYPLLLFEYYVQVTGVNTYNIARTQAIAAIDQFRELLNALSEYPTPDVVVATVSCGVCAREMCLKTVYSEAQGVGYIGMPPYEFCRALKLQPYKGDIFVTLFARAKLAADKRSNERENNCNTPSRWARHILYPTKCAIPAMIEMDRLERQKYREFLELAQSFRRNNNHVDAVHRYRARITN